MSRDNFQLRQTKNVNTTNIFRPYSYRAWILEGFFNWKIHTWKWKLQFGGELLWDHQAGTSSNTKSNFQKAIETWRWDETVNEFLPTKLTDKGSPIVTIWSNPWYFYLKNHLCLSASTTFVSFDGRGTQQALKIVWRSPPWFPESLAGFWCLETIQERRSLWSPAKKNKLQDSHRFTLSEGAFPEYLQCSLGLKHLPVRANNFTKQKASACTRWMNFSLRRPLSFITLLSPTIFGSKQIKAFLDAFWRSSCQLMRFETAVFGRKKRHSSKPPNVRFSYTGCTDQTTQMAAGRPGHPGPQKTFCYRGTTREGMWRPECKDCVRKDGSDGSWCKNATPSENNLLGWRRIFVPWLPWWQFNRMTGYTSQVHVMSCLVSGFAPSTCWDSTGDDEKVPYIHPESKVRVIHHRQHSALMSCFFSVSSMSKMV